MQDGTEAPQDCTSTGDLYLEKRADGSKTMWVCSQSTYEIVDQIPAPEVPHIHRCEHQPGFSDGLLFLLAIVVGIHSVLHAITFAAKRKEK
jgi:hypothetical protein